MPSRTRTSVEAHQNPRYTPRTLPQATHMYTAQLPNTNYVAVSGLQGYYDMTAPCMSMDDAYFPGNDRSYIPTSAIAPTDLTNWEMADCSLDDSSDSSGSSTESRSPPMTGAEVLHTDVYPTADFHVVDHFDQYPIDPWIPMNGLPPTPPMDSTFDIPDMFATSKNDFIAFPPLPESATECEYLGVSKLQFSRSGYCFDSREKI